jgi:hypothetical protein
MVNAANRRKPMVKRRHPPAHPHAARAAGDKRPFATCKQEVEFIGRYLSADLQDRELSSFEKHLAICPDCLAFLKTYKTTIDLTRNFLTRQRQNSATSKLSLLPERKRLKRR